MTVRYRDGNNKEIDLVMVKDGKISLIECKWLSDNLSGRVFFSSEIS